MTTEHFLAAWSVVATTAAVVLWDRLVRAQGWRAVAMRQWWLMWTVMPGDWRAEVEAAVGSDALRRLNDEAKRWHDARD